TADLDPRVVGPGAVRQAEAPGVPGAGDDAVLDEAAGQRGAHVRADVVDGKQPAAVAKDRDQLVAHFHRPAFALGQLPGRADAVELRHDAPSQDPLDQRTRRCHDSSWFSPLLHTPTGNLAGVV